VLWRNGRICDLNHCFSPRTGWTLLEARGINDNGQIVGMGVYERKPRAFLLSPL